ncbi:conserved hypothetical protein [Ricinus communis]|uniref:Uncharacterized protein n=1 Tax=Ricinus communis TaxID=3988 RepID=B9SG35_RICCO|nr:conserved hypothetical protein [Ricinus communis]
MLSVHNGCSSCSGTATLTGLYAFVVGFRHLQTNHSAEADNPIVDIIAMAKTTDK